jgi:Txe/YoeB family toxin of Txe-Axe toxin-antitoxin module
LTNIQTLNVFVINPLVHIYQKEKIALKFAAEIAIVNRKPLKILGKNEKIPVLNSNEVYINSANEYPEFI